MTLFERLFEILHRRHHVVVLRAQVEVTEPIEVRPLPAPSLGRAFGQEAQGAAHVVVVELPLGQGDPVEVAQLLLTLERILGVFDPTRGFWIILLGLPVTFGLGVGLVMLGLKYGAIGFYGGVGLILSIGTYVLEKRYGRHLQVDDFPLARRIITIIPAFLALAGLFMLMFYLAGKL